MPTFIAGVIDKLNRNNRIYPKEVMEKAISEYRKQIDEKRSLGELDPQPEYSIFLTNASHIVTDLRIEENNLVADIDILTTPRGIELQRRLDSNSIEFVTRGLGKFGKENTVTEYILISVDARPKQ